MEYIDKVLMETYGNECRCRRVNAVNVEKVIVIEVLRGEGIPEDPCGQVLQYWDMNGKFLCEVEKKQIT